MSEASATPAHKVYNIAHWSDGYIGVNAEGQVMIRPDRGHTPAQPDILSVSRLASPLQRRVNAIGDEVEGGAAVHRNRLTGVMR